MKKLIKSIFNTFLRIPFPFKVLKFNYLFLNKHQGKGWGAITIKYEINNCLRLIKKKPEIFIDIGANKGFYTNYLLQKVPNIECHLFEPSSENFKILNDKFPNDNISINKCALSNVNSKTELYSDYSGSGLASLTKRRLDHFGIKMSHKEEVSLVRFDSYWQNANLIIDYVKIDVEGHELDVLKGFGEIINNVRLIQFEFGGCNIDTRTYFQDFWYFFSKSNFKLYRINPRGVERIEKYSENDECFLTTNYIAINRRFL